MSATTSDPIPFHLEHNRQLLQRLYRVCLFVVGTYPFYLLADIYLYNEAPDSFRHNLIAIHSLGFVMAILYIVLNHLPRSRHAVISASGQGRLLAFYAALFIFLGSASSINSQAASGNVDAYIILLLGTAVLFPIRPALFLAALIPNHLVFLAGIAYTHSNNLSLASNQVNTTATAAIAFLIAFTLYAYRRKSYEQESRLRSQEMQFRKLFEINPYPLLLIRLADGQPFMFNRRAEELYALSPDRPDARSLYKHGHAWEEVTNQLRGSASIRNHIVEHRIGNGDFKWVMASYELIEYSNEPCVLVGITDISELKKMEEHWIRHATTDPLTGVMNRRRGMELLQAALDKVQGDEAGFTIGFIDINNLKQVNDRYGHARGDELIGAVCGVISGRLSGEDLLFRYGGDEFIVVFQAGKLLAEARAVMAGIRSDLEAINKSEIKTRPYPIAISYGLKSVEAGSRLTLDDIVQFADSEMYKDKQRSRNGNH